MRLGSGRALRGRRLLYVLLAAVLVPALLPSASRAAPGSLDPSFGMDGFAGESLEPHFDATSFIEVAEEPDGSILATPRWHPVLHYFADGRLDTGFQPPERVPVEAKAIQADGKRLEPSAPSGGEKIKRVNPDGSLDESFNGGESQRFHLYRISTILVLPSGKILVTGLTGYKFDAKVAISQIGIARLEPDGTLDRGFGDEGMVELRRDADAAGETLVGVTPEADEGLIAVVSERLVRLNSAGQLDQSYGKEGHAPVGDVTIVGFNPTPDGGAVLAGSTRQPDCWRNCHREDFFVAHLTPDGQLDSAYSDGRGLARIDGGEDVAAAVVFEADGSVALGGVSDVARPCLYAYGCPRVPAVARFDPAGRPDASFADAGLLGLERLSGEGYDVDVFDLIARRGGGLLAVGGGGEGGRSRFLAALLPQGGFDLAFGSGGIVEESEPAPSVQVGPLSMTATADGKILAALETNAGSGSGAALVRFTNAGRLDRSFGAGRAYAAGPVGFPTAVALDRASRALLLTDEGELARFTSRGELDPSFNEGRRYVQLKPYEVPAYRALAVQPDGKILIAGITYSYIEPARFRIVRLLPDGHLDRSFGRGGYATVGCHRSRRCVPVRILLPGNGRILLIGSIKGPTSQAVRGSRAASRIALFRLLPDGRPDRSFGHGGLVTARVTNHSEAKAALLTHGRVVVAGWTTTPHGPQGVLLRFRPDGSLDRSFGTSGINRNFSRGPTIATGLFSIGRRLLVTTKGTHPAVVAFHRDGRPDPSFRRRSEEKLMRRLDRGPAATVQGGKLVLGWIEKASKAAPPVLHLARLFAR